MTITAYAVERRPAPIGGIVRNLPAEQVPAVAWVEARNVVIRSGQLRKAGGWTARGAMVEGTATLIRPVSFPHAELTVIGTSRYLYRYDPPTNDLTAVTPQFAEVSGERWRADYLLGRWYFTTKANGLWSYDGIGPAQSVDTGGVRGAELLQLDNHLLLGNLASVSAADGPLSFASSDLDGPDRWDFDNPDSDALLRPIPHAGDEIMAMRRLDRFAVVYKPSSIHLLSYVGGDAVYRLDTRVTTNGLMAPAAVAELGDRHAFVGRDNIYVFAGGRPQPVADRVWKWWLAQVHDLGRNDLIAVADPRHNELMTLYVDRSGARRALVWNYEVDAFTVRDLPFVAVGFVRRTASQVPTFDDLDIPIDQIGVLESVPSREDYDLVGITEDGMIHSIDAGFDANGEPLTAELISGTSDFGLNRVKTVRGLYVDCPVSTGAPLEVYVSARRSLSDQVRWCGPYLLDRGRGRVDFLATGVWFDFRFVKRSGDMVLRGYDPIWVARGLA